MIDGREIHLNSPALWIPGKYKLSWEICEGIFMMNGY